LRKLQLQQLLVHDEPSFSNRHSQTASTNMKTSCLAYVAVVVLVAANTVDARTTSYGSMGSFTPTPAPAPTTAPTSTTVAPSGASSAWTVAPGALTTAVCVTVAAALRK
jgi:hypothetical protein